jgi:DNA-binding MarR family transcriptional regulator
MLNYEVVNYNGRLWEVEKELKDGGTDLERYATYLLNSKDIESPKKQEYKIYTNEEEFRREISMGLLNDEMEVLLEEKNYKTEKKQKITNEDMKIDTIRYYKYLADMFWIKSSNAKYYEKRRLEAITKEIRHDMLLVKDVLKGTIYFKQIGEDSSENNLDWFEMDNASHIEALLYIGLKPGYKSWYECISSDILNLLSEEEQDFVKLIPNFVQKEIADELGITQQSVSTRIKSLAKKITKEYVKHYEEYKYMYWLKGNYRTCTKCNESKLIQEFTDSRYDCKQCRKVL